MSNNNISVYQPLAQKEKVRNYTANPGVVYSAITSLDLIVRQLEKEGTGLIFCQHQHFIRRIEQQYAGFSPVTITSAELETFTQNRSCSSIVIIKLGSEDSVRVSSLKQIAHAMKAAGVQLKWISVFDQPHFHQLFKWELRYN